NIQNANSAAADLFAHALGKTFESELGHAIAAPARKTIFGCNGKNIYDAGAGFHVRDKALGEKKWSGDVHGKKSVPFREGDSHERRRTSRLSSCESNRGQSDSTMFSPVEVRCRNSSISKSRCLFCQGASAVAMPFRNQSKEASVPLRSSNSPPMVASVR